MSYRTIFDEAIGETPPAAVDVDRVVRRQRQARRVRGWAAAAAAVVAATAGVVTALGVTGDDRAAPPAGPGPEYFPPYVQGTRIIAEASGPVTEDRLTLTFTPSVPQTDLTFFIRCQAGASLDLELRLQPGTFHLADFCGEYTVRPSPGWAAFALVDVEKTVTLAITSAGPRPPGGTYGVAVGEPSAGPGG
jgi:hypothetical protein